MMVATLVRPVIVLSVAGVPEAGAPWPTLGLGEDLERPPSADVPGRPRVMLADDDKGFREMLRDLLADEGFDVVAEAADGAEAVEIAPRVHPDIVFMDLRMPHVDGIEATRLMKSVLPLAQVIILSAYDDLGLQRGAEKAGVYCYLIKGCPPQMIREVLAFAWEYRQGLERDEHAAAPGSPATAVDVDGEGPR